MIDLFVVMVSNFVYAACPIKGIFKHLLVVAVDGELLFIGEYKCSGKGNQMYWL